MEIEPIASADGSTAVPAFETSLIAYLHQLHAPAAQIALAEAQAEATETTEQLAEEGDPIALLQLAKDDSAATPARVAASVQQPKHPDRHLPGDHGIHEDGKGNSIDIYD